MISSSPVMQELFARCCWALTDASCAAHSVAVLAADPIASASDLAIKSFGGKAFFKARLLQQLMS